MIERERTDRQRGAVRERDRDGGPPSFLLPAPARASAARRKEHRSPNTAFPPAVCLCVCAKSVATPRSSEPKAFLRFSCDPLPVPACVPPQPAQLGSAGPPACECCVKLWIHALRCSSFGIHGHLHSQLAAAAAAAAVFALAVAAGCPEPASGPPGSCCRHFLHARTRCC